MVLRFLWCFFFFFPQIIFKCSFVVKDDFMQGRSLFQLPLINSSVIGFSIARHFLWQGEGTGQEAELLLCPRMDQGTPTLPRQHFRRDFFPFGLF